jgi:hypothetical protein
MTWVCVAALVGAAGAVWAEPKTLTNEELEAGWISLFDGETLFGWNQMGDAQWRVDGGSMVCDSGSGGTIVTTSQFADFELVVNLRVSPEHVVEIKEPKGEPKWHEVRVKASGEDVTAQVDGAAATLAGGRTRGHVGIHFYGHGGRVEVSDAKLKPSGLQPIFNGKDLEGWKELPVRLKRRTCIRTLYCNSTSFQTAII